MSDRIKIGIVGCGGFGQYLSDFILEVADVTALCDVDENSIKALSCKHSLDVAEYTDYTKMCAHRDLDAVAITAVNGAHAEICVRAAEHGLHVYCEKPMACTVHQCWDMINACQRNNVKLMVGHKRRLRPAWNRMIELTREDLLGEPLAITACSYVDLHNDPYAESWWANSELGGGLYHLHGVHVIDWFRAMCGDATRVTALAGPQHDTRYEYPDTIHTSIHFRSGAVASINTGLSFPIHQHRESEGPWGECRHGGFKLVPGMEHIDLYWQRLDGDELHHERYDMGFEHAFRLEMGDFVRWIVEDRQPCLTWVEGLRCVEIMEAAYRSAQANGEPMILPLYPELEKGSA